jgi:hypothetical protein
VKKSRWYLPSNDKDDEEEEDAYSTANKPPDGILALEYGVLLHASVSVRGATIGNVGTMPRATAASQHPNGLLDVPTHHANTRERSIV